MARVVAKSGDEALIGIPRGLATARGAEKALALIGLLLLMGVFRIVLSSGSSDRSSGSTLFQLVSLCIYGSGLLAMLLRRIPIGIFKVLLEAWPLILLTLLPLVSIVWSDDPDATLRRAVALLMSSAFAVFLMARFSVRELCALIAIAFGIFMLLGILAAAVPGLGINSSGEWQGLANQKNVFGRTNALASAFLFAIAVFGIIGRRKLLLCMSATALALVFLSQSATSLVSAVAGVVVGFTLYMGLRGSLGGVRLSPSAGGLLLAIAGVTGVVLVTYGTPVILEALGRDPTLTGRTPLWHWAIALNEGHEWLGRGYRAFWIDSTTKYFFESFWWRVDIEGNRNDTFAGPGHAHSGYVDLYLELGWLGVAMFSAALLATLRNLFQTIARRDYAVGALLCIIVAFVLVYASAERSILQQSEEPWFLFVLFYLVALKQRVRADAPHGALTQPSGSTSLGGALGFLGGAGELGATRGVGSSIKGAR